MQSKANVSNCKFHLILSVYQCTISVMDHNQGPFLCDDILKLTVGLAVDLGSSLCLKKLTPLDGDQ